MFQAVQMYWEMNRDENGELDEKALLIGLFVIAAIAGLTTLATAVSGRFTNLAASL